MIFLVVSLIVIGWLMCSVVAYAGLFAWYQGEFASDPEFNKEKEHDDIMFSLFIGLLGGPFSLLATLWVTRFKYGLRFR